MKNINKKNIVLILVIILTGLIISGGTYAYLTLAINVTNGNYNTMTHCFEIDYSINNADNTQDITGIMFPSDRPSGGLNGRVGFKINSSCQLYGKGTLKLHVNSGSSSKLTTSAASYCESRKTLEKINNISTETACTNANGRWRGYSDNYCENNKTLVRMTEYTDSTACASNGGTWKSGGSPLKYAVYGNNYDMDNPLSTGYITSNDIGGDITIYDDFPITESQDYYYIYIWLDGYLTDSTYTEQSFSGYIHSETIQDNTLKDKAYTVTFNANGGSVDIGSKTVIYGEEYGTLPIPTRNGYTFKGWNGKNLLNLDVQESFPSDKTTSNSTKRTFLPNTYVKDLAFNNYYIPTRVENYAINSNSLRLKSIAGYGIGFPMISSSNKVYTISFNIANKESGSVGYSALFYKEDGTLISFDNLNMNNGYNTKSFITPANTHYLVNDFYSAESQQGIVFSNILLEEGTVATVYEPYYVTSDVIVTQEKDHTLTAIWEGNS